ncbi:unnamed protein product [Allacma fusca]|uniref:Transcription termination factor 5, mitochondrial n=1 Tax=Allacma fusca TaxID=39272 RepID=A0A8J2JTV3_9HEXA|nr:unnamed protein product [Allacma fusca]
MSVPATANFKKHPIKLREADIPSVVKSNRRKVEKVRLGNMISFPVQTVRSSLLPALKYGCRFYAKGNKRTVAKLAEETRVTENNDKLVNLLEVTPACTQKIMERKRDIVNVKSERLQQIPRILDMYGFPPMSHVAMPSLLTVSPSYLENKILIFKETGINYKNAILLNKFKKIMSKLISTLRNTGVLPRKVNVAQNYIDALAISDKETSFIQDVVPSDVENMELCQLRTLIMEAYLALVLNCDTKISQNIIQIYPTINMRSFCRIKATVEILKECFGFDCVKIQKNGYLILIPPDKLRILHSSIKTLADTPLVELALSCPKLLTQTPESLLQVERDCQLHGISMQQVAKFPEILHMSNSTVRHRLEELERNPELRVLKNHPRVSRLIYYQPTVKKRLQQLNSRPSSLNVLASEFKRYERFLGEKTRWNGSDIFLFLESRITGVNKTQSEYRKKLQVNPNWRSCSIKNMKEVLDFLQLEEKLDDSIIFEALSIVIYPVEKIKTAFQETISSREAQVTDRYFLNMVLYMMEKEKCFDFSDGVLSTGYTEL